MSANVSRINTQSDSGRLEAEPGRQNLALPDPTASRLLKGDSCVKVVESQTVIEGFELYIVEQWACSRTTPTIVIVTFTGLPQHRLLASVLSLPIDEDEWSETLKSYLDSVTASHGRRKETPQGLLMVTNLSNFPSALTVIPVPGGDLKTSRELFVVNENLKRLGCSGRAGLTLGPPSSATATKFQQQYRIHESVPVTEAVVTIVKLCQAALMMFDILAPLYLDGLLCDMTESSIYKWWTKFGSEYYSIEPNDGVLGPTTVSALLGLFIGARNRLNSCGGPTVKDAFDLGAMQRAIAYFQRSQKLSGTKFGRLDRQTLDSLHRSTSKAANNEGWLVPRAVKSTVAEFGGKGGEMVMGMVGRDKAGIAEIETLDILRFSEVVSGRHARWLWQGRSRKLDSIDIFATSGRDDDVFSGDETSWETNPLKKRPTDQREKLNSPSTAENFYTSPLHGSTSSLEGLDKDSALRKTVLKSMTGRMSEARSGIGRFKEAMGRSSLRTGNPKTPYQASLRSPSKPQKEEVASHASKPLQTQMTRESDSKREDSHASVESHPDHANQPNFLHQRSQKTSTGRSAELLDQTDFAGTGPDLREASEDITQDADGSKEFSWDSAEDLKPNVRRWPASKISGIQPSRSLEELKQTTDVEIESMRFSLPRHLSTTAIGLTDEEQMQTLLEHQGSNATTAMAHAHVLLMKNTSLLNKVDALGSGLEPFTKEKLQELETLAIKLEREKADLAYEFAEKSNEHRGLQDGASDLIHEEEAFLAENLRELEVLGARLEYELSTLVSKVEDVEDGVVDLEHQVQDLEARLETLEAAEQRVRPWPSRVLGL